MTAMDDLLMANLAFYRAFNDRDLAAMDALWASAWPITCVHPGWMPIHGRDAVLESWNRVLTNPEAPTISCHDEVTTDYGALATVLCEEVLGAATLIATNIFALEGGDWRLIHHQASPALHIGTARQHKVRHI